MLRPTARPPGPRRPRFPEHPPDESRRSPAARAEGARRARDLRHSRRFRAAVLQGRSRSRASCRCTRCRTSRRSASPPTPPRACTARSGVAAVTYGAGALNMVNADRRRLRREVAGGRDLRRARARARRAAACCCITRRRRSIRSTGSTARSPATRRASTTRQRAPARHRARAARAACADSQPGLHRAAARHGAASPCAPVRGAAAEPRRSPTRSRPASTRSSRGSRAARSPVLMVGVEVRRFGLEDKVARARAPARPAGGHEPSWAAACSPTTDAPLLGTYLGVAGEPDAHRRWSRTPTRCSCSA